MKKFWSNAATQPSTIKLMNIHYHIFLIMKT